MFYRQVKSIEQTKTTRHKLINDARPVSK